MTTDSSTAEEGKWVGTGSFVTTNATQRVPPYRGEHLWTWALIFRATPGVESPILDTENLLSAAGPACYYCEALYTARVSPACKGWLKTWTM